jgi:hypothetical protein
MNKSGWFTIVMALGLGGVSYIGSLIFPRSAQPIVEREQDFSCMD